MTELAISPAPEYGQRVQIRAKAKLPRRVLRKLIAERKLPAPLTQTQAADVSARSQRLLERQRQRWVDESIPF